MYSMYLIQAVTSMIQYVDEKRCDAVVQVYFSHPRDYDFGYTLTWWFLQNSACYSTDKLIIKSLETLPKIAQQKIQTKWCAILPRFCSLSKH